LPVFTPDLFHFLNHAITQSTWTAGTPAMAVLIYRFFKGEIQQIKIEPQFLQAHLNAGYTLTRAELETPPQT